MADALQLLIALVTGLAAGFLVSMPIGPINITIINEGAQRGFLRAWMVGLGAVTMDVIYCSVGLAGFSGLFEGKKVRALMELMSFMLVTFLGFKYLLMRSVKTTSHTAQVIEEHLHPHTAYMTGLVRVLGNPAALLLWVTLSATFVAHEWVDPFLLSKVLCVVGVAIGATSWFTLISYAVSRSHKQFSDKTLLRLSQGSGALLLSAAVFIAGRLVLMLAR